MKKFLAAEEQEGEFVAPVNIDRNFVLVGLETKNTYESAMVVYVGVDMRAEDVFKKIVDAGFPIVDVDAQIAVLEKTLEQITIHRVGEKVRYAEGELLKL
mgnify:CR=1 FL=1